MVRPEGQSRTLIPVSAHLLLTKPHPLYTQINHALTPITAQLLPITSSLPLHTPAWFCTLRLLNCSNESNIYADTDLDPDTDHDFSAPRPDFFYRAECSKNDATQDFFNAGQVVILFMNNDNDMKRS
jgi:hypothetical protein